MSSLKRKLSAGRPVLGMWSVVASPTMVEIGALAGLDFQILDLEHGAFDLGILENAIRACDAAGGAPLVRVPDLRPSTFQPVLDLGARGVVVPQVRSAADAEAAVVAAKYPPRGRRGYNPFVRAGGYSNPSGRRGGKLDDDFGLVCVIIENREAFEDLEAIVAVPDLDVLYLGVYDMSLALGCGGDTRHPDVTAFVRRASAVVRAAGKTVGLMVRNADDTAAALDLGAKFLVHGVDGDVFHRAVGDQVAAFRDLIGNGERSGPCA